MDASGLGLLPGGDDDLKGTFAGVATTTLAPAIQPNPLADAQLCAIPQMAGSMALAPALVSAGPVHTSSIAEMQTKDDGGLSLQTELLRTLPSLPSLETRPSVDQSARRSHTELLPPARLVEVAHAALQSSGFRRRQISGQQLTQQGSQQLRSERSIGSGSEVTQNGVVKRERQPEDGESNGDCKRVRSEPSGGSGNQAELVPPLYAIGAIDGVARINPVGASSAAISQQAAPQPLTTSALPAPPPSAISPFARTAPSRFSVSAAAEGPPAQLNDPSTSVPAAGGTTSAPAKSAFHTASVATEWLPGCSVTTGRRSARSPAPKGSRSLSITRATSIDAAASSPVSRRGSGFGTGAAATAAAVAGHAAVSLASEEANSGNGTGGNTGNPTAAAGHTAAAEPSGNSAAATTAATAVAAAAAASAPEAAASDDLRRLAQLAEAAAMLEEQLGTEGGAAAKSVALAAFPGCSVVPQQDAAADSRPNTGAVEGGKTSPPAPLQGAEGSEGPAIALRQRAGSLIAGVLPTAGDSVNGLGAAATAACAVPPAVVPLPGEVIPTILAPVPSGAPPVLPLRPLGSMPLPVSHVANGAAAVSGAARFAGLALREGSPAGLGGEGDSFSGGGSRDNDDDLGVGEGEEGDGDDMADGSHDSAGGGSSAGAGGGRTLTERYRAALKASAAQQRSRGGVGGRSDSDKGRTAMRNGVCARIASITKERLQQVYHLNIEEAARELGIGMTKLKEHCRTLGIPRWPSRKLKSMDKLIESLNERAMTEPATKEVIADILAEIEQFKRAIYENPCLEVEEDIKRLRQSNFKKEYQQRQVEQRMRIGSSDRPTASGGAGGSGSSLGGVGRTGSIGGPSTQAGGLRDASGALTTASLAAMAAQAQLGLPTALAGGLAPVLIGAPLPGMSAASGMPSSAQMLQALSAVPSLPGQMPLLAQGLAPGLQQLLLAQQSAGLHESLQQLMGPRPPLPPGLLLPNMLAGMPQLPLPAQPPQGAKAVSATNGGDAAPVDEQ